MLNMIKMDVYRMFRTKSMYVIWIILLASALLTSFLSKIDYDVVNKVWERQQAVESQADTLSGRRRVEGGRYCDGEGRRLR